MARKKKSRARKAKQKMSAAPVARAASAARLEGELGAAAGETDAKAAARREAAERKAAAKLAARRARAGWTPWLVGAAAIAANVVILAVWVYGGVLESQFPDFFYLSSQEDEYLEWATFWAFMVAAVVFLVAAWRQYRTLDQVPWFLTGVGLFSAWVAMEEISWAQRVFGYRPPEYFLAENYQQEFNFHNVIDTDLRMLAVKVVLLGYGVFLPLLAAIPGTRRWLRESFAVVAPPWQLAPAFFASYVLYEEYPWKFTGEWVELMMGFGFLFIAAAHVGELSALAAAVEPEEERPPRWWTRPLPAILGLALLSLVLGAATAGATRGARLGHPDNLATAQAEVEALRRDFASGRVKIKCNVHKRVFTFKEQYDQPYLLEGAFAALQDQGLPEARAAYFIDPWNNPYWIRYRCDRDNDREVMFVYSFGPNRRRESSRWELLGDDVGVYVRGGP